MTDARTAARGITWADAPRSPSGRRMRVDALRNRQRIFDVTRDALRTNAYDISLELIAERAGLGIATVHRHFARRIDLLEAVYREDLEQLSALSIRLSDTDPWEALVTWLRAFLAFTEAKRAINGELGEAFQKNPELAELSRNAVNRALDRLFARAQSAGVLNPEVIPMDLIQLVGGMRLSILMTGERDEQVLDIVLRGIRA